MCSQTGKTITITGGDDATEITQLLGHMGIDRARMDPVGMGQEGLLIETGQNVAEARNRRVLVVNLGG